jgi:rhodanese-related sulfurtransferase
MRADPFFGIVGDCAHAYRAAHCSGLLKSCEVSRLFRSARLEQFLAFLTKNPFHLVLFGTALVTGGMLIWPLFNRVARPGNDVGALEAVQLINRRDAVVLDVRDASEYASGHITNAKHIPEKELAQRAKELEKFKSRPVIVACRAGGRAAGAAAALRKLGFAEVFALRGGIAAWQQASMPLEK